MITDDLRQEIKREVTSQIQQSEITDVKMEKLKNEITGAESRLRVELKAVENRLDNKISDVENRLDSKISDVENKLDNKISDVENRLDNKISKLEGMMKVIITITSATAIGIVMLMLKDIFK